MTAELSDHPSSLDLFLEPEDNERLRNVCGQLDEHLRQVERRLGIEIYNRGNRFQLLGEARAIAAGSEVLQGLYEAGSEEDLTPARVHLFLQESGVDEPTKGVWRSTSLGASFNSFSSPRYLLT